nr:beta-galactosidase trimerization domain-containing protein [bacterium]
MRGEIFFGHSRYVEIGQKLTGRLESENPFGGEGQLSLRWVDAMGRVVQDTCQKASAQMGFVSFELDTARALTAYNRLYVSFIMPDGRVEADAAFYVRLAANPLDDYSVVMYYSYEPHQQPGLRKLGVRYGKVQPRIKAEAMPVDAAHAWYEKGFPFYCDQIAVPFYAPYHSPAYEPKEKMLLEAKALYLKDKTSKEAFIRHPSFHDEQALAQTVKTMQGTVENQKHLRPLFYTTDETGVTDLIAAFDFDFDPRALADMRRWLKQQYGTLEALNAEWETAFESWDQVVPFTTDEMVAHGGNNFSPWADHRHFMNEVFGLALAKGVAAVHEADPDAKAGIVGGQMPGAFGGYDYWHLTRALDVIEPYNIGNNREIWRSLAPEKPVFMTTFEVTPFEIWRHWYQALHGDRGTIIYDEKNRYLDQEGEVTPYGAPMAPVWNELSGGIVKQLTRSRRHHAPVCIHYSHATITAKWMLEVPERRYDWIKRGSAGERMNSTFVRLRESFVKLMEDNHTEYDFLAYGQAENGTLLERMPKVVFLPQSMALSAKEVENLKAYVERGGLLVADALPGVMDNHCKTLNASPLDSLFGVIQGSCDLVPGQSRVLKAQDAAVPAWARPLAKEKTLPLQTLQPLEVAGGQALYADENGNPAMIIASYGKGHTLFINADVTDYHRWRLHAGEGDAARALFAAILEAAGQQTVVEMEGPVAYGMEATAYDFGAMQMFAFHRNYQLRISELGPTEYQSQSALESPGPVTIKLPVEGYLYNARTGQALGHGNTVMLEVPSWEPLIVTVLPGKVQGLDIHAPQAVGRGDWLEAEFKLNAPQPGDCHAIHVWVEKDGQPVLAAEANLIQLGDAPARWRHPLAADLEAGEYVLYGRDAATGTQACQPFTVLA